MSSTSSEDATTDIEVAEPQRATTAALVLLARRDFSRTKLHERLRSKGYSEAAAEEACTHCADAGYLDDRSYGASRLQTRLARRPSGRRDALYDLRRQGLTETMSQSIVEEVFAEAGGEEAVLGAALEGWQAKHGEPSDLASAKRCFDHLMRRRFPRYLVLQALSPWLDELTG